MKIQSLSIVVPNKSCINNCKFCVSRMHAEDYPNNIGGKDNQPFYEKEYLKRLEFVRDNGCNSVVLTGQTEPQQNMKFLENFGRFNQLISSPFKRIDIQTTGVGLNREKFLLLRDKVGVNTVSLSLSAMDSDTNFQINGTPKSLINDTNILTLCKTVTSLGMNLRLSLNLNSAFNDWDMESVVKRAKEWGASFITFRKLYASSFLSPQEEWIDKNSIKSSTYLNYVNNLKKYGTVIGYLETGTTIYSLYGISIIIDEDCMDKRESDVYRYLILRPDCKLYSKWDDKGSIIF